jgi:hypothetical protein
MSSSMPHRESTYHPRVLHQDSALLPSKPVPADNSATVVDDESLDDGIFPAAYIVLAALFTVLALVALVVG